tara:strand:+ start:34 stop:588 length:555 start_codon:yes stop_codon:yes gene_type:complete
MGIEIKGLDKIQSKFRKFNMSGPNIKSRFLDMVGTESLDLLKMNTPVDTGELREGWILQKSENSIVIMNDQQDLISFLSMGTIRHMANPFVSRINNQVDNMVMARLEAALAESHIWFAKLPGGKNRKFQQVGRTSAGFKGGVSFAGRATMTRAGTGRRQLKRRLSLRRRRGKSINPARKDVKVG